MKRVLILALVALAAADVYLHNPRGSNNKGAEDDDQEVQNTRRLFRSMNNRAGGYHQGPPMYYYEDSLLTIEWSSSNGCGADGEVNCEFVLQYMCDEWLRDGSQSDTIPNNMPSDSNPQFGRHESYDYYNECMQRERNQGLFVADAFNRIGNQGQSVIGDYNTAEFTRSTCQAGVLCNAQRYGYECPEERDYYPYWHPTPWRDIAVFVDDVNGPHPDPTQAATGATICDYYQWNSQNILNKHSCVGEPSANNEGSCQADNNNGETVMWMNWGGFGIPPPQCLSTQQNRPNHLGNTPTGSANQYVWTVPKVGILPEESMMQPLPSEVYEKYRHCAIRIRSNITSNDFDRWNTDWQDNILPNQARDDPILVNEEIIAIPCPEGNAACMRNLSTAARTHRMGSVFQDRSFEFEIRPRPSSVQNRIHNLNVIGRRGNIVQTFPSVEYDFVPNVLHMYTDEWLHPQWTGSDNNDNNQAGEGTDTTDRSNMVQIADLKDAHPMRFAEQTLFATRWQAIRHAFADIPFSTCKSRSRLYVDNGDDDDDIDEDVGNCGKLNPSAGLYFDGDLQKMRTPGTYYYMSSRNNNFSNRGQKGTIIVSDCVEDCPTITNDRIDFIPGDRFYDIMDMDMDSSSSALSAIAAFAAGLM